MAGPRVSTWRLFLVVSAIVITSVVHGAGTVEHLRPFRHQGRLFVEVLATDLLDARTASTIDSGLPGTCVYHIRIEDDQQVLVAERYLDLSLRFDLWENEYLLDGPTGQVSFTSLAAADSAWSHLPGVDLCLVDRLGPDRRYRVQVQIAVQPLAPEDRARLSRYVSSNSGRNREELALDLGALFGQLLGKGSAEQAPTRTVGPFFRRRDLEERP